MTEPDFMQSGLCPDDLLLARRNCLEALHENWRPPAFGGRDTFKSRFIERVRLFLDLQYTSIYRDIKALAPGLTGEILDVGCGAQPYRHLIGNQCNYRGIDTAEAGGRFGYQVPETTYFDGETWPVADASVDCILCTETLEHVLDTSGFLQEAFRCIRRGGQLILTVPFSARWHYIPYDYWRFTPSSLHWLLTAAGFGGIRVYARGNSVTVAAYKVMSLVLTASVGKRSVTHDFGISRLLGMITLPILPFLAIVGRLSLLCEGGDDCLGYTIVAQRSSGVEA